MSAPKHTPGPWRVGEAVKNCVVAASPAPGIGGSDDIEYYGGHLICESVNPENARLIAAAPELLEALESVTAMAADDWGEDYPEIIQARAAIAKAAGQ